VEKEANCRNHQGKLRLEEAVWLSNLWFKLMALEFRIRDKLRPRMEIVEEAGIKPGFKVLDYGCGPGGYIAPVSELIGENGRLYALDVMPIAIEMVEKLAAKKKLTNVKSILSDCETGLPDNSLDVVLLYDVFHDLEDPNSVLKELHRVLKPEGTLSLSDHHLNEAEITSKIACQGLFQLQKKGKPHLQLHKN
jgi:ubiquinone/menaquinone biosynthesis C-methylase UbiE